MTPFEYKFAEKMLGLNRMSDEEDKMARLYMYCNRYREAEYILTRNGQRHWCLIEKIYGYAESARIIFRTDKGKVLDVSVSQGTVPAHAMMDGYTIF